MHRRTFNWHGKLIALAVAFSLAGCASTSNLVIEDSANYLRHEQLDMVTEPSGQSTNWGLWISMEGGG